MNELTSSESMDHGAPSVNLRLPRDTDITVGLRQRQVVTLSGVRDLTIECVNGVIWLTRQNDTADYLLEKNEAMTLDSCGLVVIEACRDSRARLVCAAPQPCPGPIARNFFLRVFGVFFPGMANERSIL